DIGETDQLQDAGQEPFTCRHRSACCSARSWTSQLTRDLKKNARYPSPPRSLWPGEAARSTRRTRSSTSGAASAESAPCHVNCSVIGVLRNPSNWMKSQAVFQSPRVG